MIRKADTRRQEYVRTRAEGTQPSNEGIVKCSRKGA